VNDINLEKQSPIHIFIEKDISAAKLQVLLSHGADANLCDKNGNLPVIRAC
jgi:hypothetical protein